MSSASDVVPGSAVSVQLVRGDMEIAATCTVTYIDPKQLLACGHPVLQAGPVSLPMTKAEVVTTLASSLQSFKVINTGETIGAFTEDRESAIRGVLGARAHMIPLHVTVNGMRRPASSMSSAGPGPPHAPGRPGGALPGASAEQPEHRRNQLSPHGKHRHGRISARAARSVGPGQRQHAGPMMAAALETGETFGKLYSNSARHGTMRSIDLDVEAIPRRIGIELESARLISGNIVHPGDTVTVEATVRPWQQTRAQHPHSHHSSRPASDPATCASSSRTPQSWTGLWTSPA